MYDLAEVKTTAANRWPEIITALAGVNPSYLDGANHPCPKQCHPEAGGKDRFRLIDKTAGALLCNQCFNSRNGDGIAAVQWLLGIDFRESLEKIGDYLGLKQKKTAVDPKRDLQFTKWNSLLAEIFCSKKKPITQKGLGLIGAKQANYRCGSDQFKVIAIPSWVKTPKNVVGWTIYNITGGKLPRRVGKRVELVKVKLTFGSKAGLIGPEITAEKTELWKTEGPTDLIAFLSLDLPKNVSAFCNANGAKEDPARSFQWLLQQTAGRDVYTIHDSDEPGQQGATEVPRPDGTARAGWSQFLAGHEKTAANSKNVLLPFPIAPTNGKDLRDFLADGKGYLHLKELAAESSIIKTAEDKTTDLIEYDDDPHRLARINLAQYRKSHDGRLIFWRDEYWKYKHGVYSKIEPNELRAKLTGTIRSEFERCFKLEAANPTIEEPKPVKKVTRSLVANVIGATESMVTQSAGIQMPSWLPDRTHRNYLSMQNGILDLDAMFRNAKRKTEPEKNELEEILIQHSPDWFSALKLEYDFTPGSSCEKWMDYIKFVTDGDQEKSNLLQEWAGYLLWPNAERQAFLVFEGEGGTGKSSFFAGMAAMIGESNISSLSLEDLGDSFGLASTVGKVANIAGDVGTINGNEEAILKRYTGGDKIEIQRKFLPSLSLRPSAKMMMAWNTRPRFRDKSDGLWRRMILIPLENQVGSKRIFGMDNPIFWESEAPGILIWALFGLRRLVEQNGFSKCRASINAIAEFRDEVNPIREFFDDFLEPSEDGAVESQLLYSGYRHWCNSTGHNPLSDRAFGKQLRKMFPFSERRKYRDGKKLRWSYQKINFSVEEIFGKNLTDENLF